MIKEYTLQNGEKRFKFQLYLGVDPITGKKKKTTRRGFLTRKEANLEVARLKLQFEEGSSAPQQRMKFKELHDVWIAYYETTIKPSSFLRQRDTLMKHVLPYFGGMFVDKITIAHCQQYVNQQHKKLVNYNNSVNLVYRILQYGLTLELIEKNPMQNVLRPKRRTSEKRETEFWSREELLHFFECLEVTQYGPNLKVLYRILAYTGMRKSEALALRWSDIDHIKGTVTIARTAAMTKNGLITQETKTEAGMRTISLDQGTLAIIREFEPLAKRTLLFYGQAHKGKEQLIFFNERNELYYLDYPNHFLKKIIKKFKLNPIHVHGFRHTHCTLLFEAGASIKEVQVRLGHNDIKTTMEIYNHISEQKREETSDKFMLYLAKND